MYLTFKDFLFICIKSMFITLVFTIIFIGLLNLVNLNIQFANYVCEITHIPKDFTITVMSPGYANEIVILLTVFQIGILLYIINVIIKNPILCNLYEKLNYW